MPMKPLHLIPSTPEMDWTKYIQIKNGLVTTANKSNFVTLPVIEVFGKELFTPEDEFYISKADYEGIWHNYYASFNLSPLKVSRGKNPCIFSEHPLEEDLELKLYGIDAVKDFPDFKVKWLLFNRGEAVFETGLKVDMLEGISKIFGTDYLQFYRNTVEDSSPHLLRPFYVESAGYAGCANIGESETPFFPTYIKEETSKNIHTLSGNGKELSWSTDSQPVHEIMEVLAELMLGMDNHVLLGKLKAWKMLL